MTLYRCSLRKTIVNDDDCIDCCYDSPLDDLDLDLAEELAEESAALCQFKRDIE